MRDQCAMLGAIGLLLALTGARNTHAQAKLPLKLVQTIPLPNVHERMDHLGVDIKGQRLFAAALGDKQNTVEVIDLKAGKRVFSIPGQSKPQGVFYSEDSKNLFVANGGGGASIVTADGTVKIFAGDSFKLLDSIPVGIDADHVNVDPATKYLYVGVGDTKSGALVIIDTRTGKKVGEIKTEAGPGGIMIEKSGPRIFVRLRGTPNLGVIDREKREQIATWPVTGTMQSYALALDESHHRLFNTSRNPPLLIVHDSETGKQITQLESVQGIDDVWYDAALKRIYASGGRGPGGDAFVDGFVAVYQQKDADDYQLIAKVPTRTGACTSIWVAGLNRYYVSAPGTEKQEAAILVFEPQP
jgi:DNA-binding beta-propeller fold protein YncE